MRLPRLLAPLAAGLVLGLPQPRLGAAEAADPYEVFPRCPDDEFASRIEPLRESLFDEGDYQVVLDNLRIDAERNAEVSGRVEIRQGARSLSAEDVEYNSAENRLEVGGNVEYRDPQLVVRGETGSFGGGNTTFEGASFELPQQPARGAAKRLSVDREGQLTLEDVWYTTCPEGQPDWRIRGDSVTIDTVRSQGLARDARIEFLGHTIFRLPAISFPVGNARKSGLLFPSLGSSTNSGAQLSVPYYFNIAPQQDFTLTPTWYTSRGIDFAGEYRYLTRRSRGTLDGNLLPDDRKTGTARNRVRIDSITELRGDWRLTLDAENVSDARYFEDFAPGATDGASIAFLPRAALLAWRDPHLAAGVLLRNFQVLDQELPRPDRPHTELPRLYGRGNWTLPGALPLDFGVDLEAVNFRHRDDVQGWRLDAAPRVGLDYTGAGYFLRPAAMLESTHYRLRDGEPGADESPSRTLPVLSLDAGLAFERGQGRRGQRRVTLEPRLMYLYAPYRDQDDLPVFDTAEPDLNWVELFRTNRYVGLDRISDANQLSLGVTTQLYSATRGTRFLSMTVGETFYFETPRVLLPDEAPVSGDTSDLIAQIELSAFRNWSLSTGLQWNPHQDRTERAEVRLQYRPEPRSVLNMGYRFQRGRLEQAEASGAWPLSEHWRLYGRLLYSLREEQSIEQFAGFEYSSCCWNLRAVARDYVSRRSGERDRSIYVQLELKGLSNVGLAADAFLQKAIRGYSTRRRP